MALSAAEAFRALNGVFCIYKPAGQHMKMVLNSVKVKLAKELNFIQCHTPRPIVRVERTASSLPVVTSVPDLSDHPLVIGQHYEPEDFKLNFNHPLPTMASGVTVMSLGSGSRYMRILRDVKHLRVYHVVGELGRASEDFSLEGRLIERTTYHHVTHHKIDRVISAMQAGHQKHMFYAAGVNPHSQEAYELAAQGLIRPVGREAGPMVYGMKCIDFNPPEFTLEFHCVNENGAYLMKLVHELGLEMRTAAVCKQIRRLRDGNFTLTHALLLKHWDVKSILENMELCQRLLTGDRLVAQRQIKYLEKDTDLHLALPHPEQEEDEDILPG